MTTVRAVIRDALRRWSHLDSVTAAITAALGLDLDTSFDPARQRCVVVDVCTTCEGSGLTYPESTDIRDCCPDCGGRGVRWTT